MPKGPDGSDSARLFLSGSFFVVKVSCGGNAGFLGMQEADGAVFLRIGLVCVMHRTGVCMKLIFIGADHEVTAAAIIWRRPESISWLTGEWSRG